MQGLSHSRPGQARKGWLKVEAPRISRQHMKEARLSALFTGRLYHPGGTPGTPRATVGPEVYVNKNTPSGFEPATFRLLAQCRNQLCHRVLPFEEASFKHARALFVINIIFPSI